MDKDEDLTNTSADSTTHLGYHHQTLNVSAVSTEMLHCNQKYETTLNTN